MAVGKERSLLPGQSDHVGVFGNAVHLAAGGAISDWCLPHQFVRAGSGRADGVSIEGSNHGLGWKQIYGKTASTVSG